MLPGSPAPRPLSPPFLPTGYSTSSFLQMLHPECKELPEPNLLPGQLSHGAVGVKEGRVQWISMAFESVSSPWPRQAHGSPLSARPRSERRLYRGGNTAAQRAEVTPPGSHGYECQHQV